MSLRLRGRREGGGPGFIITCTGWLIVKSKKYGVMTGWEGSWIYSCIDCIRRLAYYFSLLTDCPDRSREEKYLNRRPFGLLQTAKPVL